MKVDLAGAQAVITPAPGKSFDPTKIAGAIRKAGFSPGPVEVRAAGVLRREEDVLHLEMAGPVPRMVLAGGPRAEELASRRDLLGKHVRVTGSLHPSHDDRPPGLTVDQFDPVAEQPKKEGAKAGQRLTVEGKLTDEGVECPAMRAVDGTFYTLAGEIKGFRPGDEVCVRGRVAEVSTCMQGTTLVVEHIGRACP